MRTGLALLLAVGVGATAVHAAGMRAGNVNGQYFLKQASGRVPLNGAFVLSRGSTISMLGITTTNIACVRPPSTAVQYPGPPFNWQPQKNIPVKRAGPTLTFDASLSFSDRIGGYPETMQIHGAITPGGRVTGKVSLYVDDPAGSGEIKCRTRGFLPFAGKRSTT